MSVNELIKIWIAGKESFYLFLPDAPYGRPFDNQYAVKKVESVDDYLVIQFDGDIVLSFIGELKIVDEGCNLLISNYIECRFEAYGQAAKCFDYGEVGLNGF
ncbi:MULTISPECIES: hypothetical protein [Pectobacterium]|uniref:hypothetical protein n=1 Tax=Pectobacterium TaxID=122277 RepID=UPI0015F0A1F2|nr:MULTISPECIES: hypothetical protein [Pectobacterium]MBA5235550.1 hypothetical protein [Pectobacterium aroidearum]MBN3069033.1 hypothetical protein [Pectobacterium brasiliense]MBN3248292.1 hypothetical protein [Pectobacterium brasiliense]